jgi:hypothetical protein
MMRKIALILGVLMAAFSPADLAKGLLRPEAAAVESPLGVMGGISRGREPTKDEMLERDPRAAEVRELREKVKRGEITLDEAIRAFRTKNNIPMDPPPSRVLRADPPPRF